MGPPSWYVALGLIPRRFHGCSQPALDKHCWQHKEIDCFGLGICLLLCRANRWATVLHEHRAPAYHGGIVAMLCGFILNLVLNQVLRLLYVIENRKLDAFLEGKSEEELVELRRISERQGFEDITDRNNVGHHYLSNGIRAQLTDNALAGHVSLCAVIFDYRHDVWLCGRFSI